MKNAPIHYKNKMICFTTMHEKEKVLSRACNKILGADLHSTSNKIDTDVLGNFSGEILRGTSQRETALKKCYLGLEYTQLDYGLASEGSFGPHPVIHFIPASYEMMVFVDKRRGIVIDETMLFSQTNYQHTIYEMGDKLDQFLKSMLFPSHALIIKPDPWEDKSIVFKGIDTMELLRISLDECIRVSRNKRAIIETDMRAHKNPTRRTNLLKLGIRLFRRISRLCPSCENPGWGKTGLIRGKECRICMGETREPIGERWSCIACGYLENRILPMMDEFADPGCCDYCNP